MKSLFVGNLPWSVTDEELQAKFSEFGNVASARVIRDKFTNRSRGFGFVDYPNDDEAQKAIDAMNDKAWAGSDRKLVVNEAKPKTDKPRREGSSREYDRM